MLLVSEARLAPMAVAISPADCSGGWQISSQPRMRPVIGGRPKCCDESGRDAFDPGGDLRALGRRGAVGTGVGFHKMLGFSV